MSQRRKRKSKGRRQRAGSTIFSSKSVDSVASRRRTIMQRTTKHSPNFAGLGMIASPTVEKRDLEFQRGRVERLIRRKEREIEELRNTQDEIGRYLLDLQSTIESAWQ